jgi:hypothetical protein
MLPRFENLFDDERAPSPAVKLGRSREGRPVLGYRLGSGNVKVSLLAGCHADEPVGPRLLDRLVCHLHSSSGGEALERFEWWIVPHINPDGAVRNDNWSAGVGDQFDLATYLGGVVRESPGDDIEFGFPRDRDDRDARPENRAVYDWWASDPKPFCLHVSLHGMAFAGGPWFLIDSDWASRCETLKARCRRATAELGYSLHDVERRGEKGFVRIERGFCTRPNSRAMASFFTERGDEKTARLFRPSSMETMRSFGGDTLTLVSEIPLFVLPGVGERVDPTDPIADRWRERVARWKERVDRDPEGVGAEIAASDVTPVPVGDQMRLQWEMIRGGVEQMDTGRRAGSPPE